MADESQTESGSAVAEEAVERPKLSLDLKVESPSACERRVAITIARPDIDRYFTEAYDDLAPKSSVPGFRVGKAPLKLIQKQYKEQVTEQVKGKLLMDSLAQVTAEGHFSAISEPEFDFEAVSIPDDGPMTFEFKIEVRPEFDLPDWRGLAIDKPVHEYTEAEVRQKCDKLLERYANLEPTDEPARPGDAVATTVRFRDGGDEVAVLDDYTVRLRGELSFADAKIEGFDKLLAGAKAGDKRTVKVKLGDDVEREDLRDKEIEAEFEILDVKKLDRPALTAEFLDRIGGFADESELLAEVRGELEKQLGFHQQRHIRGQVMGQLLRSADWTLPPNVLRRQARRELERMVMDLRANGFSDEQVTQYANELSRNSLKRTETLLKEHFVLERIAEENKIEAMPADYDDEIERIADQADESPRRVRARLEKRGQMDTLRNQIVERKVLDMIVENAKVKETPFKPQRDDVEAVDFTIARDLKQEIPEAKPGADLQPLPGMDERKGRQE